MIPLHYLWGKSNNRTGGQFECDVTCFAFALVSLLTCMVRLLFHSLFTFQVVQIKQVHCKMRAKNVNNY